MPETGTICQDARPRGCEHECGAHTGDAPVFASAGEGTRAWLLIEHAGSWPDLRDGYGSLPAPIAEAFARAQELGIRPQLIRAPGARRPGHGVRVMAGWSSGEAPWLESATVVDLRTLSSLDLAALSRGEPPGFGEPHFDPVFLICTHAKRNACCARLGLPLARHLLGGHPGMVWESSHVGGDRFAANLVCLPHGLYYGNMSPAAAEAAVAAYRSGEIVLDRFRGRSGMPAPLQAADHFVRALTGERSLAGVVVESYDGREGNATEVLIRGGGVRYKVVVEPAAQAPPCGGGCAELAPAFRLTRLWEHHSR